MYSESRPLPMGAPDAVPDAEWPDNPVLTRIRRGDWVESQHRGAWVLVDASGEVVDGVGHFEHPVFARSSIKSLQALPLIETGAARQFGYTDAELALALASHNGEDDHTGRVRALLERMGLGPQHLRCGAHAPWDPEARREMARSGAQPSPLHNNCSGKHAGFLALALHLGVDPAAYLDPESDSQRRVRDAVGEMAGAEGGELTQAIDGCSAPTFRMPLVRIATAIARVANPDRLETGRAAACRQMTEAVGRWPELIAGRHKRLCTDLVRVSRGRVFAKIGGDAVYVIGAVGANRGIAIKVDDGEARGFNALVVDLCRRFGFLSDDEVRELGAWTGPLKNYAGLEVGTVEVLA